MRGVDPVFKALANECQYQDRKWGRLDTYTHDVGRWIEIMRHELAEAIEAAWDGGTNDAGALQELLQATAVGVAALQQHGVVERPYTPPEGVTPRADDR